MTAVLVLAAGNSTRMGRPKALLTHVPSGRTFVAQLTSVAREAGLTDIFVIGRPQDQAIRAEVERASATFVPNPHAQEGQLSSLLCGLAAASHPSLGAILVMPVDVPLVSACVIQALLEAASHSAAPIVRAAHAGRHGHPVLFRRAVFDELRSADAQRGARSVVRADPGRVLDVEVEEPGVTLDIDTPADYARAFGCEL